MEKIIADNKFISDTADITLFPLINIDSTEMDTEKIILIAKAINENIKNYDGILITHGTDTMAYTAALLSVMLDNPAIPIVITGSQKPYFSPDTDAKKNLTDAFTAVCEEKLKCVSVVFNEDIFSGSDCYKSSSVSFSAFSAYDKKLGKVKDNKVTILNKQGIYAGKYKFSPDICSKVALIKLSPNFDENIIDMYISNGIKGFVIEGYGTGGIPERVIKKLKAAAENNIPSMLITQCRDGGTDPYIYEVGHNMLSAGIIDGKKLGAEAALAVMMKMTAD